MVFNISEKDKILVIAALPDDLAIACGGFICKYHNQTDILCINYNDIRNHSAFKTEFSDIYDEITDISKKADINKLYIEKPTEKTNIDICFQNCLSNIDIKDYDAVLIPNYQENSVEHKFIRDIFLKAMLEAQGYKDNLKILMYEIKIPLKEANYYEDITNFVDKKIELINSYKKESSQNFGAEVLSLNKFRTYTSTLKDTATHVEAYFAEDLDAYIGKPDIVNESTDTNFRNDELEKFLNESNAQAKIDSLAKRFSGKKVVLFGAGDLSRLVFKNYDLSNLNIIAIADRRFEQEREHEFYSLNCIKPSDIPNCGANAVIISDVDFVKFYDILVNTILNGVDMEIAPLIKTDLEGAVKGDMSGKICVHPFHTLSIVPTGHCITCCPAYIKNFTIGNIFKEDIADIWRGKRAKYLRNALMNDDYTTCDLNTCIHLELRNKNDIFDYFDKDSGEIKMPDTIFMSWDYDCNVACITCRNQIIKNDEKTLNQLQKIEQSVLDACKNAKFFYASGNGDPFGSSYARDIIKKIIKINPNIRFLIHTNGTLCNKKICDELDITDKMNTVTFSIHAAHKETYDKIVRYGNFDNVMKNLEWISSMKKDGKVESIFMVFVVHKLNYKDMPDFVRLAEKFGAIASFRYYRQWSNNTEYNYDDMAVFETNHPEHREFVEILKDKIFDSPNCFLDPNLRILREQ